MALVALVGLAGAKIWVALGRGKTNIGFLVILGVILVIAAIASSRAFRTARGNALIKDLRTLFRRLKDRAGSLRPGGATSEAALLAAVFGLGALPASGFAYATRLYPKAATARGLVVWLVMRLLVRRRRRRGRLRRLRWRRRGLTWRTASDWDGGPSSRRPSSRISIRSTWSR